MKKTTMYLPEELLAELRVRARQEGRPVAEIVREASAAYLAKKPERKRAWVAVAGGPHDGRSGGDVKPALRDEWGTDLDAEHERRTVGG